MNIKPINIVIFILFLCLYSRAEAQENLGYNDWPKNGVIRCNIELPVSSFGNQKLQLARFTDNKIFFNVPLSKENSQKKGRFQINIYDSIEEAQSALLNFIYALTKPVLPNRFLDEDFPIGDVAFGEENRNTFFVIFTRDNVRVILDANKSDVKKLALEIDTIIQNSSIWAPGNSKPTFHITEEFKQAFYLKK